MNKLTRRNCNEKEDLKICTAFGRDNFMCNRAVALVPVTAPR